jgi:aminoglycoside phosphotransferase family enzyme/predicted kinase
MIDWKIADYLAAIRQAHADEAPGDIQWIETHISWICLTQKFVYKIKKPVKNAFLDYSTLDLREHFCREELRLDSRYAPSLYLQVIPITIHNDVLQLGGTGNAVEYCVQMRRFPSGALLSERLSHNTCHAGEIVQLGNRIARFHQSAAIALPSSGFGAHKTLLEEALDNVQALLSDPSLTLDMRRSLELLEGWTRSMYTSCIPAFDSRKAMGFIRECHGDLHSGNVVWWNDELTPFDGIEFNESFRWIDVLSDIAFLAMDLEHLRHAELASILLSTYLEQTGDYCDFQLLRWYLVYRSLVRAKVSWLTMVQSSEQTQTVESHQRFAVASQERDRFIGLALKQSTPRQGRLWITHGLSGSGKSTGAMRIVEQFGALRIRADVERKRLFGFDATDRPDAQTTNELYSATSNSRTYERLLEIASKLLGAGQSVIVDATFLKRVHRKQFADLAKLHEVPFTILQFEASEELLRSRLNKRLQEENDASDANADVLKLQVESCEPLDETELPFCVAFAW